MRLVQKLILYFLGQTLLISVICSFRGKTADSRLADFSQIWRVIFPRLTAGLSLAVWLLSSLIGNAAAATPSDWSVGFKQIERAGVEAGVEIGVWYPSTSPVNRLRHGPFDVEYADHGMPVRGKFPVVLMSHGMGGWFRNHHLTASSLVRRGYVVIAPQHRHDWLIRDNRIIKAMEHRLNELTLSLAALDEAPQLNAIADMSRIHGLGYSLGSATILVASGQAKIDLDRLKSHCSENEQEDPNFCGHAESPWYAFFFDWFKRADEFSTRQFGLDLPILTGDVALIAPMGQAMSFDQFDDRQGRFGIFAFGDDEELPLNFHGRALRQILPVERTEYREYSDVHHYAFISPFPKWLMDMEDIPVAKDPPGFDRLNFLTELNKEIVNFFEG